MMKFVVVALALAPLAVLACSSSSGSSPSTAPCNEDPWQCAAGQTCWPKDTSAFQCLNSGPGAAGSACTNTVGSPTCGDHLACLQLSSGAGQCVPYCDATDPSHACSGGALCRAAAVGAAGTVIHVCVGGATTDDAGGSPDAGEAPVGDAASSTSTGGDGGPADCAALADHESAQCPSEDRATALSSCEHDTSLYAPIGCGAEWSAYVSCAAAASYDCTNGPAGCDNQQNAYFACQSAFARSTSCSRITDDALHGCSGATPYAFSCLGALPQGCVGVDAGGSTATFGCCPQFPAL